MNTEQTVISLLSGSSQVNPNVKILNEDMVNGRSSMIENNNDYLYCVGVVLMNSERQVCLVQESKESCKGKWYLPSGRVNSCEDLHEAAIRECKEETGYVIEPLSLYCLEISKTLNCHFFLFTAIITGGELKTYADEESLQAKWFDIDMIDNQEFKRQLRHESILKLIDIGLKCYKSLEITSTDNKTLVDNFRLKKVNLIVPSLISNELIVYTYIIVEEDKTSYLVYENDNSIVKVFHVLLSYQNFVAVVLLLLII